MKKLKYLGGVLGGVFVFYLLGYLVFCFNFC